MRKRALLLLLAVVLTVGTTGCYDRREVDENGYVLAIGFDQGINDKLRLTLQILTFKGQESSPKGGGGLGGGAGDGSNPEKGETDGTVVLTVDCPSIFTGINMANMTTARQLSLMHAKMIIFSEEMAKSGEMEKYILGIIRYREVRRIMYLMVTKGTAEDFVKENKTMISMSPSKTMQLLPQQSYTGLIPPINLFSFYNDFKSTEKQPIAILANVNNLKNLKEPGPGEVPQATSGGAYLAGEVPRRGGVKRELFGAAVFRGGKMVGEINGSEVRALDMVTGDFRRGFITIKDPLSPDHIVPLDVLPSRKTKIKVNTRGDVPEIQVKVELEGDLLAVQSGINYESVKLKRVLEQAFEQETKSQLDELIAKCQHEFRADIFGFGRSAAFHFPTIEAWERYQWFKKFPNARINTEVKYTIRRTGTLLKSAPVLLEE